jgi:peptidyl-prolyl cis-trans isomerase SurA
VSASEIVIAYEGAPHSQATRTKEEAHEKARELLDRAQKREPFSRLAKRFSDSTSASNGGFLGTFEPDTRGAEVAQALLSIRDGQIVPEVIETPFGFHILRREKVVHVGHVLIMHEEARMAHNEITRTEEEARAEAERLHKLLSADGADFGEIARQSSDCRKTKLIGGDLGYYGKGGRGYRGGQLMPELVKAVARLTPGGVSEVTESDYGFHVAWRFPDDPTREQQSNTQADGGPTKAAPDTGPEKTTR